MYGEHNYSPYLIIGKLSRDFLLTAEGECINNIPGGHLIYTAVGMTPWERHPVIVARVGKSYPEEFIELLKKYEFSTQGIKRLNSDFEQRNFISYYQSEGSSQSANRNQTSVLTHYFNAGKPFPRDLLGYNIQKNHTDSLTVRTEETILARDIPQEYLEARCIHLCPMDYLSHNLLPQAFSETENRTITVHAGSGYMQPYFYDAVKILVNGLTAFIVREQNLKNLFFEKYRISKVEDMMKILLDYGAENIVVKAEDRSYYFINRVDRTVKRLNPGGTESFEKIGELSCFCGAYVVGLNETYSYQTAVAYGAARADMLRNELNPFNNLEVYDALVKEKARIMESKIEG